MIEQIKQTADFIKSKVSQMPQTAIILGTGLGELVNHIDITEELNYQDIPNFPISTVEGHSIRHSHPICFECSRRHEPRLQNRRHHDYHRPYQFIPRTSA